MPHVSDSDPNQGRDTTDYVQRFRQLVGQMAAESRAVLMDPMGAVLNPDSSSFRNMTSRRIYAQAGTLEPESLDALAQHLLDDPERNRYIVPATVARLDRSFFRDPASVEQYTPKAAESLHQLAIIFLALDQAAQTEGIKEYKSRALKTLLEHWSTVTMWIAHLIGQARLRESDEELDYVFSCVLILTAICTNADTDPYKAELVSLASTADSVCLLLCLKGGSTGLYITLQPPGKPCKISLLFSFVQQSEYAWDAILNLLRRRRPAMRGHIFTALTSRIHELALNATKDVLYSNARSLAHLVTGALRLGDDEILWAALEEGRFISEVSSALCDLAKKAQAYDVSKMKFWECLGVCTAGLVKAITLKRTPHSASNIGKLLRGGIIDCVVVSLPHLMNASEDGLVYALQRVLPFLYMSKVEDTASKGTDRYSWALPLQQLQTRKLNITALRQGYQRCIQLDEVTFSKRKSRGQNICANLWHEGSRPNASVSAAGAMKTCAGCYAVNYCSAACQAKDWTEFHSKECPALAKNYVEEASGAARTTARMKEDQLRFLDTYVNSVCPSPRELRAQTNVIHSWPPSENSTYSPTQPNGVLHHTEPFLSLIDNYANGEDLSFYSRLSFETRRRMVWAISPARPFIPRMEKCARDMEENPDTVTLVEGIFRFGHDGLMSVFAKMRYVPELAEGERYSVTNSCFWVM